jgi:hypothetical protein
MNKATAIDLPTARKLVREVEYFEVLKKHIP